MKPRNNTLRAHRAVYGQNALRDQTIKPEKGKGRKERPKQKGPTEEDIAEAACLLKDNNPDLERVYLDRWDGEKVVRTEGGFNADDNDLDFYVCQTCRALVPDPSRPWVGHYEDCPERRAAEKQASRDEDARRLRDGEVTGEELRRENGAFAFPNASIDFSKIGRVK